MSAGAPPRGDYRRLGRLNHISAPNGATARRPNSFQNCVRDGFRESETPDDSWDFGTRDMQVQLAKHKRRRLRVWWPCIVGSIWLPIYAMEIPDPYFPVFKSALRFPKTPPIACRNGNT